MSAGSTSLATRSCRLFCCSRVCWERDCDWKARFLRCFWATRKKRARSSGRGGESRRRLSRPSLSLPSGVQAKRLLSSSPAGSTRGIRLCVTGLMSIRDRSPTFCTPQTWIASIRRALELTREAAGCMGLPLIPISHNGRDLLDRFINWELAHGGVLAGIGLALGGWIADVLTASTMDSNHLIPGGSDPNLDPLWSTERTTIHADGVEVTRTNKVISIASSDLALSRLKVCWREDIDTNCGRC